jgi:hypothetical protein
MLNKLRQAAIILLLPVLTFAQDFPLNPMSLSDWKTVSGKWSKADNISIHPIKNQISVDKGASLLYASGSAELETVKPFGDLKLEFEFLQAEDTRASIILGGGLEINLNNSSLGSKPFIGTVEGSSQASQNVCKATGLWQKAEITFVVGNDGEPAILEKLKINGIIVHENVFNWSLKQKENPIKIVLRKGTLAIRKMAVLEYGKNRPVRVENLSYSLEETFNFKKSEAPDKAPPSTGFLDEITYRVPHDFSQYLLSIKGDLIVEEAGSYAFTIEYQGIATLAINGNQIAGFNDFNYRVPSTGIIELSKGKHHFEYNYTKAWWPSGLGLFVAGSTFRPYPLHGVSALPDLKTTGGIFIEPTAEKATLIRSFMEFGDEKKTQVLSVGSPKNRHFSFDLGAGAPLYGWKGNFADVTEMWYERGEPQIIQPLGQTITFTGKSAFKIGDSSGPLKLDEYYLDHEGIPTFNYLLNDQLVSQKLIPGVNGLTIEVGSETNDALYLLASDVEISSLGEGLYQTPEYFIKIPEDVKVIEKKVVDQIELWAVANELQSFEIIW